MGRPVQTFTDYPPAVYMQFFLPCSADKPCTRSDEFTVDPVPKGCCVLTVTNGDGRGTNEVSSYEVFLNGERVFPPSRTKNAEIVTKISQHNSIRVVLTGEPNSKIFVLIAYDPRESRRSFPTWKFQLDRF
jgi:hypothetical protein